MSELIAHIQAYYLWYGLSLLVLVAFTMWLSRRSTSRVLGIDVGNAQIKIVEVQLGKRPVLLKYAIDPTPPGAIKDGQVLDSALLEQTLSRIVKRNGFSGRRVATALTGQNLLMRTVELPTMPKKEVREAVKWQFNQYFQMSSEETVADYQVISGGAGEPLTVMLVAMQKEPVVRLVNVLAAVGLKPTVVDIEPLAVLRAVSIGCDPAFLRGTIAVFDFGAGTTNISVFKDSVLRVARTLHLGGRDFSRALTETLELPFEQAEKQKKLYGLLPDSPIISVVSPVRDQLFLELSRTVSFYLADHREESLAHVFLLGGGSLLQGLKPQLESYFNEYISARHRSFAVTLCNPLEHISVHVPKGRRSILVEPEVEFDLGRKTERQAEMHVPMGESATPEPEMELFMTRKEAILAPDYVLDGQERGLVPRSVRNKAETPPPQVTQQAAPLMPPPLPQVPTAPSSKKIDTLALGLTLSVALGMALGEVKHREN